MTPVSSKKDRYKERVVGLHEKGCTPTTIARAVGDCAPCSVRNWLREWGFEPHKASLGRPMGARTGPEVKERVNFAAHREVMLAYHDAGLTPKAICAELADVLDVRVDSVRAYLKRQGVKPHRA